MQAWQEGYSDGEKGSVPPSEVKQEFPPSEVAQARKALAPLELVERVRMVGEVVAEETLELEEAATKEAWVVSLAGEAMVEEVHWYRRHSHLQCTPSEHQLLVCGQ